ncbi:MAG: serine/threonine-protein kinase [Clostridiales bacterium]
MKNEIIYKYEPLWGDWKIEEILGRGSVGNVYKLSRDFFGEKQYSAVKVISIPTDEQYNMFISSSGHSNDSKVFFEDLAKEIAKEINLLYQLKGHSNIIAYEDHMIKNVDDKWHIFIRMEYAECLSNYIKSKTFSRKQILKLGIDICSALEFCHSRGIMHRDVKEENIFVSINSNAFKLGDFSVSKETTALNMAQTKVGTLNYMPPEIINGKTYNKTVDMYSLGLVLYKLFSNGRLPFLPKHPDPISFTDIEQAYIRRLKGDIIPKPDGLRDDISKIILKTCDYDPNKRYQNVETLKRSLEKIYYNMASSSNNSQQNSNYNISSTNNTSSSNLESITVPINTNVVKPNPVNLSRPPKKSSNSSFVDKTTIVNNDSSKTPVVNNYSNKSYGSNAETVAVDSLNTSFDNSNNISSNNKYSNDKYNNNNKYNNPNNMSNNSSNKIQNKQSSFNNFKNAPNNSANKQIYGYNSPNNYNHQKNQYNNPNSYGGNTTTKTKKNNLLKIILLIFSIIALFFIALFIFILLLLLN